MLKKLLNQVITLVSSLFSGNVKKMTNSDYSKLADDAQLIQSILIEDTPFVAGKQDGKWYLLLGKYRLTEDLPTIVDVVEASKDTSWNRLIDICQTRKSNGRTKRKGPTNEPKRKRQRAITSLHGAS